MKATLRIKTQAGLDRIFVREDPTQIFTPMNKIDRTTSLLEVRERVPPHTPNSGWLYPTGHPYHSLGHFPYTIRSGRVFVVNTSDLKSSELNQDPLANVPYLHIAYCNHIATKSYETLEFASKPDPSRTFLVRIRGFEKSLFSTYIRNEDHIITAEDLDWELPETPYR